MVTDQHKLTIALSKIKTGFFFDSTFNKSEISLNLKKKLGADVCSVIKLSVEKPTQRLQKTCFPKNLKLSEEEKILNRLVGKSW